MDIETISQKREFPLESSGSGSRLEDLYGVQRRVEQPRKKVKKNLSDEVEHKNGVHASFARRSNGIMGQYMKPNADKEVSLMVDLTNDDDDDDEVMITGSTNIGMQQVCFGHLRAKVSADHTPKPRPDARSILPDEWPVIKCTVIRTPGKDHIIKVADPHQFVFGNIEWDLAAVLAPAMDGFEKLYVQARLMNRKKKPGEWPHQECSTIIPVSLNIYGLRRDALKIGQIFGQKNIWFQPPMAAEAGYPWENPHPNRRGIVPQHRDSRGRPTLADTRTVEEAADMVTKLFDHGSSAASELQPTDPPQTVLTNLMPHQKQGLTFMLQREKPRTFGTEEGENSSLWRKTIKDNGVIYKEVVSGISVKQEPEEVLGGLLGDDMGLGKTIQTLSLLAATTQEAEAFGKESVVRASEGEINIKAHTKATLLVCPLSTIKNWEDQIPEHIKADTLTYHIYHGSNRIQNPFELTKFNIIITTYGTVNAEVNGRSAKNGLSPLIQLKWFRIVLDEAHTIREANTKQSKAICSLHAQRRWCLTGTAIQNRIDDLGSLTKFLRLYPYDTATLFNQYIRGPATTGDAKFMLSLRVFVDSFSLRRLKDRIDLPKRSEPLVTLPFSIEEKKLHDFFKDLSQIQVQELTRRKGAGEKGGKQMHSVLQGILALRRIAAHGRELLNDKDLAKVKGITAEEAIDLESEQEWKPLTKHDAHQHLSMLAEAAFDFCRTCQKRIGGDSPSAESNDGADGDRCYVLPCYDVVCYDCFEQFKESFDVQPDTAPVTCPFCQATIASQYVAISAMSAEGLDLVPDENAPDETAADDKPRQYTGPHTKTKALLKDVQEMKDLSVPLVEASEPPLKCVVFSEWTQHLDLIERALTDYDHTYVRIDGKMSLQKRRKVLDAFNSDDDTVILLASIKAAGQGLNLTAASRVFIMEPLWNPAAEVQAVDRVHRIGQKREVIITRYRMEGSIEQKIGELQQKKIKLADVSMNRNYKKLSQKELREQNLKDIAALFK
jgi:SNF2 family DNA or RNA helicase